MAIFIRSVYGNKETGGERTVAKLLRQLADDCFVYFQPNLKCGRPDFIAIIPDIGVFVVEVKDWRSHSIAEANEKTILLRFDGREETVAHPIVQAERYLDSIRDGLNGSRFRRFAVEEDASNGGNLSFVLRRLVILTNIERSELDERRLGAYFPEGQVITKDELAKLTPSRPDRLYDAFRESVLNSNSFRSMNEDQIAVVRSVIAPESVIQDSSLHLRILDLDQETFARRKFGGHRLIYGPAGTGKTIMLLARAKQISSDRAKRVLVLCFNRLLCDYLRSELAHLPNVEVRTFHGWGYRNQIYLGDRRSTSEYGLRFLDALANKKGSQGTFDAILVDEGQLFPKEWYQCVMAALSDDDQNELLIAGDGLQAPKIGNFTWDSIGIKVRGRGRSIRLTKVYRTTKQIFRSAQIVQNFAEAHELASPFPKGGAEPSFARVGPFPKIVRLRNRDHEATYAANRVQKLLLAGFEYGGTAISVKSGDIAVVYPPGFEAGGLIPNLITKLKAVTPLSVPAKDRNQGSITDENTKLISLMSVAGLQFAHVIIVWTDMLNAEFFEKNEDVGGARLRLQIAMTRAEQTLTILHSADSPLIDEIASRIRAQTEAL